MLVALLLTGFADPVQVTPAPFAQAKEPQVAIDADSRIYVAYGMGDAIFVSVSHDRGVTFAAPVKVGEPGKLALGMRRGPRIGVHQGVVTITAAYGVQGKGRDGDIVAFRSPDGGLTWTGPVRVNDVEGSGREGLHAMAVARDGTLACAWLDLRERGTTLYLAESRNGGQKWSENRLVYASPSGSICECCHPSLAFDRKGAVFVMFRNSLQGARDMYLSRSTDLKVFSPPSMLGQGKWMINACPMDGGMLAITADGVVETVWRREAGLYRCRATGQETSLGSGRNPWIASGPAGAYLAWQSGRSVLISTPDGGVREISTQGSSPVVTASGDGKLVVAAWNENGIRALRL